MLLYDINFKDLFNELIKEKIHVDVIHSERSQLQRDNTVRAFRAGQIWVLICTELMGRGIDFKVKFTIKFYAITRVGLRLRHGRHIYTMYYLCIYKQFKVGLIEIQQS